jgi:hypothetical protein
MKMQLLSLPALQSREMMKVAQAERIINNQLLKQQRKIQQQQARTERKRTMRIKQEQRVVERARKERENKVMEADAALTIQRHARGRLCKSKFGLKKRSVEAATRIQGVFRAHNTFFARRRKQTSVAVQRKRRKVVMWQATTTVIIALMRWLRRSRIRRWRHFMQAVKQALQREPHIDQSAKAASRRMITVSQKPRHHTRHHRRESSVSALTVFQDTVATGTKAPNVQRLSIIETDDSNTLAIEILHIASKTTMVINVEHFMWARLGKGKLEDMDQEQRDDTCAVLLDCCLMQTGRTSKLAIFESSASLCSFFKSLLTLEPSYRRQELPDGQVRTMAEIFAERIRLHVVKKGEMVYEHGTIGKRESA